MKNSQSELEQNLFTFILVYVQKEQYYNVLCLLFPKNEDDNNKTFSPWGSQGDLNEVQAMYFAH